MAGDKREGERSDYSKDNHSRAGQKERGATE